ncbi:MAG: T9SS type A sorting domain-containing protein [Candidatus Kapaibacterium sp.]
MRYLTLLVFLTISVNSYAQWQKVFQALITLNEFTSNSNYIFCATQLKGVLRSSDNGLSWDSLNLGLSSKRVYTITAQGDNIFAGTDSGLFRSTNNGNSWSNISNSIYKKGVYHLDCNEQYIFAGTISGIYCSINFGQTWDSINNGLPRRSISGLPVGIDAITHNNNTIFIGVDDIGGKPKIYKSINYGNNWEPIIHNGLDSIIAYSLEAKDSIVLCGTYKGVYISRNNGLSWRRIPEISPNIGLFGLSIIDEQNLMISHFGSGVYVSTDGGRNWFTKNEGLNFGEYYTCALYTTGDYTFLATRPFDTYLPAIFRRTTQQLIPVIENSTIIPKDIELYQNYPNPFNSSTTIRYSINKNSEIKIKVFDIIGKEVRTITSEKKTAGIYEVKFDGGGLSSGIYIYSLFADNIIIDTKKLIIVK